MPRCPLARSYRPILDAARSFGDSTDIEDLVCGTTRTGMYNTERDPTTPELVRIHKPRALRFSGGGLSWYKVTSLQQVGPLPPCLLAR